MPSDHSDWFPTSIWHFNIENFQQLNQELDQAISQEQKQDKQGVRWSNALGWHSIDNLNHRKEFKNFLDNVRVSQLVIAWR